MTGYIQTNGDGPWVPYIVLKGWNTDGEPRLGGERMLRSAGEVIGLSEKGMMDCLKATHATVQRFEWNDGEGNDFVMLATAEDPVHDDEETRLAEARWRLM